MPIKKFTMKEVDDDIGLLIEQMQVKKQPPEIIKQLVEKAKAKRMQPNGNAQS